MALGSRAGVADILMGSRIVEFLNEGVFFLDEPDRAIVAKDIFDTFNFRVFIVWETAKAPS